MEKDFSVDVISQNPEYERREPQIKKALEGAFKFLGETGFVEVGLVGNEEMRKLNKQFRGKDEVTNVLSFGEPDNFPQLDHSDSLGNIYLAPDFIESKGQDQIHLVIHGFLHLLGYTHDGKSDTIDMERKEDEILDYLN